MRARSNNATGPERLSGADRAGLIAEITGRPLAFDMVTGDVERLGVRPPKLLRDVLAGALKSPSA